MQDVKFGIAGRDLVYRYVHPLPDTGPPAAQESPQDPDSHVVTGHLVGLPHLTGDGGCVVFAVDAGLVAAVGHLSAQGQVHQVRAEVAGPRTGGSERSDRCVHQFGVAGREIVVAEGALLQVSDGAALEQYIGRPGQGPEVGPAGLGLEVHYHRSLSEVVMPEIKTAVGSRLVTCERTDAPGC